MFTETAEELNHRYTQTFIGLRAKGKVTPVYVGQFSKVGEKACSLDGAQYFIKDDTVCNELFSKKILHEDIVWPAPLLGYINCLDKTVKWVFRSPEQQPARTRGLLPAHTLYWYGDSNSEFYTCTMRQLFEERQEVWDVASIYNPVYFSAEEAWRRIRGNEYRGVAISRNIAMMKTHLSRKPVVFYKDLVAGLYDKNGTIFLLPKAHLLYEEISLYAPCEKVEESVGAVTSYNLNISASANEIALLVKDNQFWPVDPVWAEVLPDDGENA